MLQYLILLFVLLPLLDLVLLLKVADVIGIFETVLLVVFTGVIGASLVKMEGLDVLRRLQGAVLANEVGQAMLEGALVLAGGVFLLSPGIVTDGLGFLLVFKYTRQRIAAWLRYRLRRSSNVAVRVNRFR